MYERCGGGSTVCEPANALRVLPAIEVPTCGVSCCTRTDARPRTADGHRGRAGCGPRLRGPRSQVGGFLFRCRLRRFQPLVEVVLHDERADVQGRGGGWGGGINHVHDVLSLHD